MGAVSANILAIQLVIGPMLTGRHTGERHGACMDCRRFWAKYRACEIDADEIEKVDGQRLADENNRTTQDTNKLLEPGVFIAYMIPFVLQSS